MGQRPEGLAAPGLAHQAAWAMLPAAADPAFTVHAAPILRSGLEVWLASGRLDHPAWSPPDLLTPHELTGLAYLVVNGPHPVGPVAALARALEWFGITLCTATALAIDGEKAGWETPRRYWSSPPGKTPTQPKRNPSLAGSSSWSSGPGVGQRGRPRGDQLVLRGARGERPPATQ